MSRIVVLGDLNLDVRAHLPSSLAPGEEARDLVSATVGGSAGTFARVAAAHGASVTFLGCVGNDPIGDLLVRSLEDAGVEALVQRADLPSGVILALKLGSERSMVCSRGANDGIRADRIERPAFHDAVHLHVSGYAFLSPAQRPAVRTALAIARQHRLSVSIDPPPANLIRSHGVSAFLELLPPASWLFPNRSEGELLAGIAGPTAIVDRLACRFEVGALTLGEGGALAWAREARHAQPVDPIDGVDTTGAGDAFAGAFVVAHLQRGDVRHSCETACIAARHHLTADGSQAA